MLGLSSTASWIDLHVFFFFWVIVENLDLGGNAQLHRISLHV